MIHRTTDFTQSRRCLQNSSYNTNIPGDSPQQVKVEFRWSDNGVNGGMTMDSEWAQLNLSQWSGPTTGTWQSTGTLQVIKYYSPGSYYLRATPFSGGQFYSFPNGQNYMINVVVSVS